MKIHPLMESVFLFHHRRDRLDSRGKCFIQIMICVHSFETFCFVISLHCDRSIWVSIPVISSWTGTPFPFEHLSLIYGWHYSASRISWPSWRLDHFPQHDDNCTWKYVTDLLLSFRVSEMKIPFSMSSLHTFTFIKSLYGQFLDEWTLIDALTSSSVMPVLQRGKVIVDINASDLEPLSRSALFNDARRVDVQYALIVTDDRSHADLVKQIPRGSRSHPRFVPSATFVKGIATDNRSFSKPGERVVSYYFFRSVKWSHLFLQSWDLAYWSHLWYILSWAFNELVQLPLPDENISELEVFQPPHSPTPPHLSRLVRLNSIYNEVPPILTRSLIVCPDNIEEGQLFSCDRDIALNLPSLRHLNVMNSHDSLHRCSSISMNIQSLIIVLCRRYTPSAAGIRTTLRSLRTLPRLQSLRVILYDFDMPPDGPSCEMIAETAISLVDFAFCFRRCRYRNELHSFALRDRCCSFIEQRRQRIFTLALDKKPECSVEKDACGLIVWPKKGISRPNTNCLIQTRTVVVHWVWQSMIYCWIKTRKMTSEDDMLFCDRRPSPLLSTGMKHFYYFSPAPLDLQLVEEVQHYLTLKVSRWR